MAALRELLSASARKQKLSVNPIGLLGDRLRSTRWPEPKVRGSDGTVVIPGGRRRRRRKGPIGDTKNDLP